jgi:putative redox protein
VLGALLHPSSFILHPSSFILHPSSFILHLDMVQIDITYQGKLRCEATHAPSQNVLLTDAPKDNMGQGESFSPTDLVATGLGACMLTIMGIVAQRHQWPFDGAAVKVRKEMITAPARRIGRLVVEIYVPGEFNDEQRKLLENAAHTCPVHKSLHPDIEVPVTFWWGSKPADDA